MHNLNKIDERTENNPSVYPEFCFQMSVQEYKCTVKWYTKLEIRLWPYCEWTENNYVWIITFIFKIDFKIILELSNLWDLVFMGKRKRSKNLHTSLVAQTFFSKSVYMWFFCFCWQLCKWYHSCCLSRIPALSFPSTDTFPSFLSSDGQQEWRCRKQEGGEKTGSVWYLFPFPLSLSEVV